MNDLIESLLPVSLLYAFPLLPLFVYFWWIQVRNNKTFAKMNQIETKYKATDIVRSLLEEESITDIPIELTDDYSQHHYLPMDRKILLGPDTYDQQDITAIGQAARAAGKAIFEKNSPEMFRFFETMKKTILVFFWFVFTVLAFGLMGNSVPTVITGYSMFAAMMAAFIYDIRHELALNKMVAQKLEKKISADILTKVQQVMKADALKL